MITPEQWIDIERLKGSDPMKLRLSHHGNADMVAVIDQIECRGRCAKKLALTLSRNPHFVFPSTLSAEQSTSDILAAYHASLIPNGARLLDMTCGLGIDVFHAAEIASSVTAYDIVQRTAECAKHNAKVMGLDNVTILCGNSEEALKQSAPKAFDCIFIDPARRAATGKRLYALSDCSPNVVELLPAMLEVAPLVIIKASPMLDVSHTLSELQFTSSVSHIMALGSKRECKELIIICHRGYSGPIALSAVTLDDSGSKSEITFTQTEERDAQVEYSLPNPGQILYEPYPATVKMAPLKLLASRFALAKIAPNSHLYVSEHAVDAVPARQFEIEAVIPFSKKGLREVAQQYTSADITTRNFPLSPEELAKKLKLPSGGPSRLFATRTDDAKPILIFAHNI